MYFVSLNLKDCFQTYLKLRGLEIENFLKQTHSSFFKKIEKKSSLKMCIFCLITLHSRLLDRNIDLLDHFVSFYFATVIYFLFEITTDLNWLLFLLFFTMHCAVMMFGIILFLG